MPMETGVLSPLRKGLKPHLSTTELTNGVSLTVTKPAHRSSANRYESFS